MNATMIGMKTCNRDRSILLGSLVTALVMGMASAAHVDAPALNDQLARPDAGSILGNEGWLLIRSQARMDQVLEQFHASGWTLAADRSNPLSRVDYGTNLVVGYFCQGDSGDRYTVGAYHAGANCADLAILRSRSIHTSTEKKINFILAAASQSDALHVTISRWTLMSGGTNSLKTFVERTRLFSSNSGDVVDGLRGSIRVEKCEIQPGEDIRVEFSLIWDERGSGRERSAVSAQEPVWVWDGQYSKGYRNDAFLVETPDGKTQLLRPAEQGGWLKNLPHPVPIDARAPYMLPGSKYGETWKSLQELGLDTTKPGFYRIAGIYMETAEDVDGGRCRIWGGNIATETVDVTVRAPSMTSVFDDASASSVQGSRLCLPSPGHPQGWRGDGHGRYPGAEPPVTWGRESVAVSLLRSQATQPKDGEVGQPMKQGVVAEWLVAGPIDVAKDFKLEKDPLVADTGALQPAEGGELTGAGVSWKKLAINSSVLDWSSVLGRNHQPGMPPAEVLAHAYVYSPSGGTFGLRAMHNGTGQVFVNGKKAAGQIELAKGWNRILIQVLSGKTAFTKPEGLDSRLSFYGTASGEYVTNNVAWMCQLQPNPIWQNSDASSPVIAGDSIFVTTEYRTLCCLNRRTGKVLWMRTSTFYDTMTQEEKNAHPEIVRELEPLAASLRALDERSVVELPTDRSKLELEKKINKLMSQVDAAKYSDLGVNKSCGEVGVSIQTPVTDGKRIYVSYVAALLVCYDMDGNRQWAVARNLKLHGERVLYPASPVLIDGKFIAHNPWGTVALDAKTGVERWRIARADYQKGASTEQTRQVYFDRKMENFPSALLCLRLAQEPLVISTAYAVRARDGKLLTTIGESGYDCTGSGYSAPVIDGTTLYKMCKMQDDGGMADLQVWHLPTTAVEPFQVQKVKSIRVDTQRFPIWCFGEQNASLLYHEGLVYCVNADGVLSVVDVGKGEVAYQQLLDADLFMSHNYGAGRGGMCAAPTLAGKYIYLFGNQGTCLVIKPGRSFQLVARNRLENVASVRDYHIHQDIMVCSPVFDGGRMFFRTDGFVYCIEEKESHERR